MHTIHFNRKLFNSSRNKRQHEKNMRSNYGKKATFLCYATNMQWRNRKKRCNVNRKIKNQHMCWTCIRAECFWIIHEFHKKYSDIPTTFQKYFIIVFYIVLYEMNCQEYLPSSEKPVVFYCHSLIDVWPGIRQ